MLIEKEVNPRFEDFVFDWDYSTYLLVGGYGSSKSYHIALKIILKLLEETRKVLVVREVYETIRESCFDLFIEILIDLGLTKDSGADIATYKVSPMQINFRNGSKIIFKGMDKPGKLKSINGVSIVWLEEASEVKYDGYKELKGRLRHPTLSLHTILSTNPVGTDNWVYTHFFKRLDDEGNEVVVLDDMRLYKKHTIVKNGTYYHHSTCDDNLFLPEAYIRELDEMRVYDPDLYRIARKGQFGINGKKVLPQFTVADTEDFVLSAVKHTPREFLFNGFDFGFETSYNAIVRMAVDDANKILYIYDEYYRNHMTDDRTAKDLLRWEPNIQNEQLVADCAEPKTITFFAQEGFKIRPCRKISRIEQVKKIKRFHQIICSPRCRNTIRELKNLTYAKDAQGNMIMDEFNIDPHTFSAIWYGLDTYNVADIKHIPSNTQAG